MTITAVGSTVVNNGAAGSNLVTSVTPTAVGDVLVVYANPGDTTTLSGGGVTTWNFVAFTNPGTGPNIGMWWGVITSIGTSNLTMTSSEGNTAIAIQQFHWSGSGGTWGVDAQSANNLSSTSGSGNYPPLTPVGTDTLYIGMAGSSGVAGVGGTSAGYVYNTKLGTSGPLRSMAWVWWLDATTPTSYSPNWAEGGTTTYCSMVLNPNIAPISPPQLVMIL